MKRLLLVLAIALTMASCGPSKDASVEVVAYQWTATLENATTASGVEDTESEARAAIKHLSKSMDSKVVHKKVKKITKRVRKSKF